MRSCGRMWSKGNKFIHTLYLNAATEQSPWEMDAPPREMVDPPLASLYQAVLAYHVEHWYNTVYDDDLRVEQLKETMASHVFACHFEDDLPLGGESTATVEEYTLFMECSIKARKEAELTAGHSPKKTDMKKKKRRRKPTRITMPPSRKKYAIIKRKFANIPPMSPVIPSPVPTSDEEF